MIKPKGARLGGVSRNSTVIVAGKSDWKFQQKFKMNPYVK